MVREGGPAGGSPGGNGLGWVLWSGTIGLDSPVPARIEAALAGGYDRMTIGPPDVARAASGGVSWEALGRSARDVGLGIVMDPMMGWYNDAPPPGPYAPFRLDEMLRMCEALRRHVHLGARAVSRGRGDPRRAGSQVRRSCATGPRTSVHRCSWSSCR